MSRDTDTVLALLGGMLVGAAGLAGVAVVVSRHQQSSPQPLLRLGLHDWYARDMAKGAAVRDLTEAGRLRRLADGNRHAGGAVLPLVEAWYRAGRADGAAGVAHNSALNAAINQMRDDLRATTADVAGTPRPPSTAPTPVVPQPPRPQPPR